MVSIDSSKNWMYYYKNKSNIKGLKSFGYKINKILLNSFQKIIIKEIANKIKKILKEKNKVYILSAGSGIDFIAYHLKKKFKNKLEIKVLDISQECILENKKIFGNLFNYITNDIFTYKPEKKFDIIYNTGLLEHFSKNKQKKIILNIDSSLNPKGYYITLNPYEGGKLYIKYMNAAKRKGTWEFGEEIPIKTLKDYQNKDFKLIKEYSCCSLIQLSFLKYGNKLKFILLLPIIVFFRFVYLKPIEDISKKYIGDYSIISIFKNK